MKKGTARLVTCCLTGTIVFGSQGIAVNAAGLSAKVPVAGMEAVITETYSAEDDVSIAEYLTAVVNSEFDNIAVSDVNEYANIRKKASEDSDVVGKLYSDSIATVLDEDGDWVKVESGSVTGYVKKEFLILGDEAAEKAEEIGKEVATVTTQTLKVRESDSTDAAVVTLVAEGEELTVKGQKESGWYKVKANGKTGYVAEEFVEVEKVYQEAESKAEEEARLKAEAAKKASSSGSSSGSQSSSGSTSSSGQAVANYALQFVGNPYVWGGSSLTNGADCSGFVMAVYRNFGVSLPHSSSALRSSGRGVSYSEAQPGDIICYSGHVGIYIGNGQIVHASSAKTGIKVSNATYKNIVAVRRIF